MIALAFANAAIRQLIFIKYFTELRAHQFSTITLMSFCSVYVWLIFSFLNIQKSGQAFRIGLMWMILTIAFEFSLGRLTNHSWTELLQQYNFFSGHIWPLFLLWLLFLPLSFYYVKK
jgi:hypothetical protein